MATGSAGFRWFTPGLLVAGGCGTDKITCGEGTHLEGTTCVADAPAGSDSGGDSGDPSGEGEGEGGADDTDDSGEATGDYSVCGSGGGAFTTLQEALDAASAGDTLTVCAGTYEETLISTMPVTLVGVDGSAETVLDAGFAGTAIKVRAGGTFGLQGFTVRNGSEDIAALDVTDGSLLLNDVVVEDNEGGSRIVRVLEGSLVADGLVVQGNQLSEEGYLVGVQGGDATLTHAWFVGNDDPDTSTSAYAVGFEQVGNVEIYNSLFYNHDYMQPGWIDGVSSLTVLNSVFHQIGSAFWVWGLGLDNLKIENSIFTSGGYDYTYGVAGVAPDVFTVEYSLFWEIYLPVCCDEPPADATYLYEDPEFVDPETGDFHLDTFSPGIDAGNPASAYNDVDGSRNDLGIYGGPFGEW